MIGIQRVLEGTDWPVYCVSMPGSLNTVVQSLGRALLHPGRDSEGDGGRTITPRLIVAHQPTWGLDIGAVAYVQQRLIAARDAGAAVLLISDDLDEVMTLGDRIAVMHQGRLTEARAAQDWTREGIGLAMTGAA